MVRRPSLWSFALFGWLACALTPPASAQCLLCPTPRATGSPEAREPVPLSIEIETGLDFPRLVSGPGAGSVIVSPGTSPRVTGAVRTLGGVAMHGSVLVRGEPGRALRIDMPDRVTLRSPRGDAAEIRGMTSNLPPAPRLGPDGLLRFHFGGRLEVGAVGDGDYRGRIPITVDYL